MNNWEDQFNTWSQAPSQAEQDRSQRIVREISDAINASPKLAHRKIEVFPQGSYANRVNVKRDSDVDICCLCRDTFHYNLPTARTATDYSFEPATYTYTQYKSEVEEALIDRFGRSAVQRGNKAIDVHDKTRLIDADVVATFEYRDYSAPPFARDYSEGTVLFSDDGNLVTNFPSQQYSNGVAKHDRTNRRFKRQVRIQKSLRNKMEAEGLTVAEPIKSFLIESLCWNAPDDNYGNTTYVSDFENVMNWSYSKTGTDDETFALLEVNARKRLFAAQNSWTRLQLRQYLESAWAYAHQ
ncbi:nucleotidyltransferase domain-containing protein [Phyllobacterium bourgognense]|uniref:cGAS/DncV-like nucleotidyltransferase C-terminal helical domain-containing protein n=1 Tax=Phyllobacterium bourgognense TaxID=314236 RepID=A0A368YL47_9HYPH|nr:nucleotidyltransferase [Phyllobacterium bourgognense]RCW80895.1 hypothetical protein C7476_11251 [Phyllobacterium bourgognense]